MNAILDVDAAAAEAALPLQGTATHGALGWLATLADQPQLRLLCGGVVLAGLLRGDRRLAGTGVRMLLAHEAATAAKASVKARVDRRRPRSLEEVPDREALKPRRGGSPEKEESSFPSGHSAGAAAVARAFARAYPEHRVAAYLAGGAAALVQIPRCAHYPSDVGAGLLIGVAAEAATARLAG